MKKFLSVCCMYLFLVMGVQAAPSSDVQSAKPVLKPSAVYFTQDVSPQGLKKIYKKLSSARSPKVWEYAPDSFLYNADDSILTSEDSPNALLADFPADFADVITSESNLKYISPHLKNHPVAKWHEFRFYSDLCYDPQLQPYAIDTLCKTQHWYPAEPVRENIRLLLKFQEHIQNPQTVVVLSKFKINGPNEMGGPLQNMLGGNIPFDKDSGKFIPLAEWWSDRLADPQKETLFITVLTDIPGEDGKLHHLGMVGASNLLAVQQAALDLIKQVNKDLIPSELEYPTKNWELESSHIMAVLSKHKVPEKIAATHNWKLDKKGKKQVKKLIQQRNSPAYKLIPIEK